MDWERLMAKTTRDQRAQRWRIVPTLVATTVAITTFQFLCAAGSIAQVKAPSKNHLKAAPAKEPDVINSVAIIVELAYEGICLS